VNQGDGRINRPSTASLPGSIRKVADPVLDVLFSFFGFLYYFFASLVNPMKQGDQGYTDSSQYSRRSGPGDDGNGPTRRRQGGFRAASGFQPPAGG
jgi:hypothetical protein